MIDTATLIQSNSPFWPNGDAPGPRLDGVSSTCYDAGASFVNCTLQNTNMTLEADKAYSQLCDSCLNEYSSFESSCNDTDFSVDPRLMVASLACHKENDVYCAPSFAGNYTCDDCGKYIAIAFNQTNTTSFIKESNQTQVTDCLEQAQSEGFSNKESSADTASVSILFVTALLFK